MTLPTTSLLSKNDDDIVFDSEMKSSTRVASVTSELKPSYSTQASLEDISSVSSSNDATSPSILPSPHVLEALPPHIREIADRRPELVQQLFAMRQSVTAQKESTLYPIHETQQLKDRDEDDENVFEGPSEHESLLRRRTNI